jgi:large subunit ribosomal protein LP0
MAEPVVKELSDKKKRKVVYWNKLEAAFNEYKNILVITVDFVGSKQMQEVRMAIRGRGVVVMGKNTIMRKVIRENLEANPKLAALLPLIKGNMGFIFTNDNFAQLRKEVTSFKMPAAAKSGVIAPVDVVVPAGPTGLDPGQTSFFQTMNVSTKIVKGAIEITSDVRLCFKNEKVTASAVALLSKLNIKPFEYGIMVNTIYENGEVYDAAVLDLSEDDLVQFFCGAVAKIAAISYELGEINETTLPQSFGKAFMLLAAVALSSDYDFAEMEDVKKAMEGAAAAGSAGNDTSAAAAVVEEVVEEEEAAPAVDLFGGDDGGDY